VICHRGPVAFRTSLGMALGRRRSAHVPCPTVLSSQALLLRYEELVNKEQSEYICTVTYRHTLSSARCSTAKGNHIESSTWAWLMENPLTFEGQCWRKRARETCHTSPFASAKRRMQIRSHCSRPGPRIGPSCNAEAKASCLVPVFFILRTATRISPHIDLSLKPR